MFFGDTVYRTEEAKIKQQEKYSFDSVIRCAIAYMYNRRVTGV